MITKEKKLKVLDKLARNHERAHSDAEVLLAVINDALSMTPLGHNEFDCNRYIGTVMMNLLYNKEYREETYK